MSDPKQIRWVKLSRYCELTGDTRDAVYSKRARRIWSDGLHCKMAPDGVLWVNLEEVEKWVEQDRHAA